MAPGRQPVADVRSLLEGLARRGILRVALAAFALGIFLHACVLYAVLDDSGGRKSGSTSSRPAGVSVSPVAVPATPPRLPDRTTCDAIRGTDYRSESERRWFLANCATSP